MADQDRGPLARVVYEALGRMASESAADAMVESALSHAGRDSLGEDPSKLASFVMGPLYDVVAGRLGESEAEALLVDLAPIVERASSSVRPEPPPTPAVATGPAMLIASRDADRVEALRIAATEFEVHVVDDVFELVQGVERFGGGSTLAVVVDCRLPTVHPGAMATLRKLTAPTTRIILWGAEKLPPIPGTEGWQRLSATADAPRVVSAARARPSGVMTFSLKKPGNE